MKVFSLINETGKMLMISDIEANWVLKEVSSCGVTLNASKNELTVSSVLA